MTISHIIEIANNQVSRDTVLSFHIGRIGHQLMRRVFHLCPLLCRAQGQAQFAVQITERRARRDLAPGHKVVDGH
jgi:hypothetical protein